MWLNKKTERSRSLDFLIFFSFFLFPFVSFYELRAQSNGGFENWSTEYTYQTPDDWQTLNFLSLFPPNSISAFKATGIDKHSGNYALKMQTIFINNNPMPGTIDDTIGGIFKGKIIFSPPSYIYGFPYTGRPEKLEFWSKYTPVGMDVGGAAIILRRWNGSGHDTIAFGDMGIVATAAYTLFQLTPTYYSTAFPDTAIIAFASSNNKTAPARVGSTIYIDDVALTGWVGIEKNDLFSHKVKVFPNPAKEHVNILAQIEEADNVQVADSFGKLAGVYKIHNYAVDINTSLFAAGIYCYEIRDKKDRILTKGKFNVVK